MKQEVVVPQMGESVTEGTVSQIFKQVGQAVAVDEVLCEIETDKVAVEVNAPVAGVVQAIQVSSGDNVAIGQVLMIVDTEVQPSVAVADSASQETPKPANNNPAPAAVTSEGAHAMPSAAKLAKENNVDLAGQSGSGKQGRILKEDVQNMVAAASSAPSAVRERRVPMTRLRQTVARRLKEAQNSLAILTTFNEVDMAPVMELRKLLKDDFEKKNGVKLGFMSFFVKAAVNALQEIPAVNAQVDGNDIIYKDYYNVSVAVGTPQGLVVPVLRDCDALSFADIEKQIGDYGRKARDGKLSIEDMQGGTFTISNGGVYGSLMSTPIVNPPQSAILGMHKIQERPMVIDGQIVVRPMMYLALSYDHRLIDGKEAVTFLVRIKQSLEEPRRLLLGL